MTTYYVRKLSPPTQESRELSRQTHRFPDFLSRFTIQDFIALHLDDAALSAGTPHLTLPMPPIRSIRLTTTAYDSFFRDTGRRLPPDFITRESLLR